MSDLLDSAASLAHGLAKNFLVARGHSHSGMTESEIAETKVDPYEDTPKYAKSAVIFICGCIALLGLANLVTSFMRTKLGSRMARSKAYRRTVAFYRWVETSQPKAAGWIRFPTAGVIGIIVLFWLFIGIWTFAQQPYYRSRWNVGSPPLAMRTGMFALGCFPFILAFGAKWNLVGFVVGCSHEKLQVFHQWLSHLFLILSLLHTFPFVKQGTTEIRPNTDGLNPNGYSQLYYSWFVSHKVYYWSGIAALIPLAFLCWGSLAPLRNRSYEVFKALHIVSAILFSAFFYIHCNALLTSWHYIWATAAIYFTSVVVRFGLILVRNGRHVARGRVEALADNAVRVTIRLPFDSGHRWTAGQHYFVNFFKVRPLESHPYTVANAPRNDPSNVASSDRLVLVFRINPLSGLGPRLLSLAASSSPTTPVLLDGPYGGLSASNRDFGRHDSLVLIGGGAGMSFCTAVLEEVCERVLREENGVRVKKVEVWWAVRDEEAKTWFDGQIHRATEYMPEGMVTFHLFVTGSVAGCESKEKLDQEDSSLPCSAATSCAVSHVPWQKQYRRPSLASLLSARFASAPDGSTIGIASCGPASLTTDVRRAVAARQRALAFGGADGGAAEVELHTEEFEW
ncbi:ferric reductase NAD binding domain-containing protein [Rhodotorula diobovata]|uniref:ferric-chelate reductase (NADPH) n=1 Tax=Rhodotorula diobovata TaxID=5288 RepID=A0A5C5FTH6_9BASI|nr:ferric reductase NAD binding domain-containing protein [Rhodotorula diobovata]